MSLIINPSTTYSNSYSEYTHNSLDYIHIGESGYTNLVLGISMFDPSITSTNKNGTWYYDIKYNNNIVTLTATGDATGFFGLKFNEDDNNKISNLGIKLKPYISSDNKILLNSTNYQIRLRGSNSYDWTTITASDSQEIPKATFGDCPKSVNVNHLFSNEPININFNLSPENPDYYDTYISLSDENKIDFSDSNYITPSYNTTSSQYELSTKYYLSFFSDSIIKYMSNTSSYSRKAYIHINTAKLYDEYVEITIINDTLTPNCIYFRNNGEWKKGKFYVYKDSAWKEANICYNKNGDWKKGKQT